LELYGFIVQLFEHVIDRVGLWLGALCGLLSLIGNTGLRAFRGLADAGRQQDGQYCFTDSVTVHFFLP
jgi:hypothetical protein